MAEIKNIIVEIKEDSVDVFTDAKDTPGGVCYTVLDKRTPSIVKPMENYAHNYLLFNLRMKEIAKMVIGKE